MQGHDLSELEYSVSKILINKKMEPISEINKDLLLFKESDICNRQN